MRSGRPTILNIEPSGYDDEARTTLQSVGRVDEMEVDRPTLLATISAYDVLITRLAHRIDADVLDAANGRLSTVVTATTGLDHIDLEAAAARGVSVLSLKGRTRFLDTVPATSEHTWALILATIRHIPSALASVRAGEWDRDRFRGTELDGKRLGVVGYGRIGRRVASYGRAFGMSVSALEIRSEPGVDGVSVTDSEDALLGSSDILTLHLPLDASTEGWLNATRIGLLPPGAIVVNTARGGLVDEEALLEALRAGRIAGAALDVLANELSPAARARSALVEYARGHDNLIITPHIGGATVESMAKTERFMARVLAEHLAGTVSPPNESNPKV